MLSPPLTDSAVNKKPPEFSAYGTLLTVFCTHGLLNSALLSAFNPLRCAYFDRAVCTMDQEWMLNWWSLGHGHVFVLLSLLAVASQNVPTSEQRTAMLAATIMASYLTTGIFILDECHAPMALLQALILVGLLVGILYTAATTRTLTVTMIMMPSLLSPSSFDRRRKLSVTTIAVLFHFLLALLRVYDFTFGSGRDSYLGDASSSLYQVMSHAAVSDMLWTAGLLGYSVLFADVSQQKGVLVGHAAMLFVSQVLLTGKQGELIEADHVKNAAVGTLFAFVIALVGAY